jgi:integrase
MPRTAERLTDTAIKRVKGGAQRMVADGRGLYLRVGESGSRSWIFRYRDGKKQTDLGLGSYPDVTLAMAREKALALRRMRGEGRDPLTARKQEKASQALATAALMTFQEAAEKYMASQRAGWSAVHATDWQASLVNYVYPVIGALNVADIDTAAVLRVLTPIWEEKNETATRVRSRIEKVLGWAAAAGYRARGDNPALWKGHLEHSLAKPTKVQGSADDRRHPALRYPLVAEFVGKLRAVGSETARVVEFAILTASRIGEVVGATWEEIDLESATWTVPGARMKSGREHKVPLSARAVELLQEVAGDRRGGLVWHADHGGKMPRQLAGNLVTRLTSKTATLHGMRATFSTWARERTGAADAVVEMSLAHTVGNAVERAYGRTTLFDQRRRLMDQWADYCDGREVVQGGDVVPLRPTG